MRTHADRLRRTHNPLVAGSSPARPTAFLYFSCSEPCRTARVQPRSLIYRRCTGERAYCRLGNSRGTAGYLVDVSFVESPGLIGFPGVEPHGDVVDRNGLLADVGEHCGNKVVVTLRAVEPQAHVRRTGSQVDQTWTWSAPVFVSALWGLARSWT